MASPYQLLLADWQDCTRCEYHEHRKTVVMYRGVLPADVVFVGQAPGISENAAGLPFEGPAGHQLLRIVDSAFGRTELCAACGHFPNPATACPECRAGGPRRAVRCAYFNLVGCIPPPDEHGKEGEPDLESIEECRPRLQGLIDLARPRLLVQVGSFARKWVTPGFKNSVKIPEGCKVIDIDHPGSMLPGRAASAQRGFLIQRAEVTLSQAVEDI